MLKQTGKPDDDRLLPPWITLTLLAATFVAAAAGVLDWLGGQAPATALLTAGTAFGGTTTLAILLINTLRR